MIQFPNLPYVELFDAFEITKEAIDESHRSSMLFDYLDDSFFQWIALNEKNGLAFNYYKDQRDLIEWSLASLAYAYGYHNQMVSESIDTWVYSDLQKYAAKYYLDNSIFRIYAILERIYKFCDTWFELKLENKNRELHHSKRLFDETMMKGTSEGIVWIDSVLFSELKELRASDNYNAIRQIRNDLAHNQDQRNCAIKYNKSNMTIELLGPDINIDTNLLDKTKYLIKDLYKIRVLEANALSEDMDKNRVRRILPYDQDYWTDSDNPLF